jgi:CheY-like chemotaxis protein
MREFKYDVRRGADTYRMIFHSRLKSWILKDIIKRDEALVWRSGLSGWRRPEDLPELKPYFEQRDAAILIGEGEEEEAQVPFPEKEIETILIVDDEEDLCWLLSNSLKSRGYAVAAANTISEAVACLKDAPDLVFLDLKLPDGDGMDILPQIETMSPDAVVVIISAYGSEERRLDAKKRGVHAFVDKPLSEEKIQNTIHQFQKKEVNADG